MNPKVGDPVVWDEQFSDILFPVRGIVQNIVMEGTSLVYFVKDIEGIIYRVGINEIKWYRETRVRP